MISEKDLVRLINLTKIPLNAEGQVDYSRCFIWIGARTGQYPVFSLHNKHSKPHRAIYEYIWGNLHESEDVHHECGNKLCINPFHLYAVDHAAHTSEHRRSRKRKTICKYGHKMTEENTYKHTSNGTERYICRKCREIAWKRQRNYPNY